MWYGGVLVCVWCGGYLCMWYGGVLVCGWGAFGGDGVRVGCCRGEQKKKVIFFIFEISIYFYINVSIAK